MRARTYLDFKILDMVNSSPPQGHYQLSIKGYKQQIINEHCIELIRFGWLEGKVLVTGGSPEVYPTQLTEPGEVMLGTKRTRI